MHMSISMSIIVRVSKELCLVYQPISPAAGIVEFELKLCQIPTH